MCCGLSSLWLRCFLCSYEPVLLSLWVMVTGEMVGRDLLFHCPAQTVVLLWRLFKERRVLCKRYKYAFHAGMSTHCSNHCPRYKSLFLNLAAWTFLENADWMPLVSFEKKSAFSKVNLLSVCVVLHVASISKSTFYEHFISVENDQILADEILDYLPSLLNASKQTSWNLKKFLVP